MRFLRSFLPHISLALSVSLLVVVYLDRRNPMMGFLVGAPFFTLAVLACAASAATAVVYCIDQRKPKKRRKKAEKVSNDT